MAAAKKRTQTRKKTTARKSASATKKAQTYWQKSRLFRLCFLLCVICAFMLAAFKLGVVGQFIFHMIAFFAGILAYPVLMLGIVYCVWVIWNNHKKKIPLRFIAGTVFIAAAVLIYEGCREFEAHNPWYGLQKITMDVWPILTGRASYGCGLIGALLSGTTRSMFDVTGSYLIAGICLIIGLVMLSYSWFADHPQPISLPKRRTKKEQDEYDDLFDEVFDDFEKEEPKKSPFHIIDASSMYEKPAKKKKQKPEKKATMLGMLSADETEPEKQDTKKEKTAQALMDDVLIHDSTQQKPAEKPKKAKKSEPAPKESAAPRKEAVPVMTDSSAPYELPPLSLLDEVKNPSRMSNNMQAAKVQGQKLIKILEEFNVKADLKEIHIGPSVTKFEIKPELGVRVSKISGLQDDIKMALAATDIRIEAPIPGKNAVGIEIPNIDKTPVQMKDLMSSISSSRAGQKLLFALGKDLMGDNVYGQLDRMPHLLIAGATGSGKSVCVNTIICSLLMRTRPDEVKLILIDPKKVEFTPYNDVPHLLAPVITDGDLANKALKVVVQMMDARYDLFETTGVRNIASYNEYAREHPEENLQELPKIVVIIDELADLMLVAAKEVEQSIQRITQLARAAGIVLIVATQRPSVDVITGVIKSNIPSRIAFAVASQVDSRTILDQAGAERLLGYGDMLYLPNGENSPRRVQGVFIKDNEVNRIASYVKSQARPQYDDSFVLLKDLQSQGREVADESSDPLYNEVKHFVITTRKASTSLIQRKFSIGYSRAARLMDVLEDAGVIGPANGSKPREVLVQNTLEEPEETI